MIFEYYCDCGYENSFLFDTNKISDFVCSRCKKYIGSSNYMNIEFSKPIYNNRTWRIITNHSIQHNNSTSGFWVNDTASTYNIDFYLPQYRASSV